MTVVYTVAAPAGSFTTADNGAYSVALQANQVQDSNGLFAAAAVRHIQRERGEPATAAVSRRPVRLRPLVFHRST